MRQDIKDFKQWKQNKDLKKKSTNYKQAMWALRELKILTNKLYKENDK